MNVIKDILGSITVGLACLITFSACSSDKHDKHAVQPTFVTEQVKHDADDPAIWVHPTDPTKSLIVGTDKDSDGALYLFDLQGKIVRIVNGLKRPNNVDIAYGFPHGDSTIDIAVATERERDMIRVFRLPDMQAIDGGGIPVFKNEAQRAPMGLALYTKRDSLGMATIYAIVSRKGGPTDEYLHQYRLSADSLGTVSGELVRMFGKFSGKKEIESIAVDNELGYIYYSDEQVAIRKYFADPAMGNRELATIPVDNFKVDNEGISIYKHADGTGYILVSDQDNYSFKVYPREGNAGNPHAHPMIANIPTMVLDSDGSDVLNYNFGPPFESGLFVAMSDDKTFHLYKWSEFQTVIDAQVNTAK